MTITDRMLIWGQKYGPAALTWGLLVLLCWLLARWSWVFLSPKPPAQTPPKQPATVAESVDTILGARLFGNVAQPVQGEPLAALNLKLNGVFATEDKTGAAAVINTGQKDGAFRVGDEVLPGAFLEAVFADHILLRHQGVLGRLNLEGKSDALKLANPAETGAGGHPTEKTLARSELNRVLQEVKQPRDIARLGTNPAGQHMLAEVPRGSIAEKLGLQPGDVVLRVNGHPVRRQEDLPQIFLQLSKKDEIVVDGLRDGKPLQLEYKIQ